MVSTQHACLGYAETQFLSITAVIADAMVKAADVTLLGLEPNGTEGICIRIGAETPASLQAALDKAEALATEPWQQRQSRLHGGTPPRLAGNE